jgi:hypothetical protein
MAACTSAPPMSVPLTATPSDPGPPPTIPTTEGATLTLTGDGVSPKQVRVYEGSRVTFVNDDARVHDMRSDPLHLQTDCPELNVVGMVVPGQSRASDPLQHVRPCGFHDHVNEGDVRFYGTVFVDPRTSGTRLCSKWRMSEPDDSAASIAIRRNMATVVRVR